MFEYIANMPACFEYATNISALIEYHGNILDYLLSIPLWEYIEIFWIYHEYVSVLIKNIGEYIGIPSTNSAVAIFDIEYDGNITGFTQLFYTNSIVRWLFL